MNTQKSLKMYVLVRNDLSNIYKIIQGSHALAEYLFRNDKNLAKQWNNQTVVYLGLKNESVLSHWHSKLSFYEKKHSIFYEPDIGNQLTAIACIDEGEIFKNLKLA